MASQLLLLLVLLSTSQIAFTSEITANNEDFEYLLLAQFWPATSCYFYWGEKECSGIPKNVTGWTIHGLWPAIPGSMGPQFCNSSLKFDFAQIESLKPQLQEYWPYLDTEGKFTELWNHEWTKHGTCAQTLPTLKGEMGYFQSVMKLQRNLNVSGVLEKHQIKPSPTAMYKPQDIFNALQSTFGTKTVISCMYDKKTKTHHLEQVWICFTKTFEFRDCPEAAAMATNSNQQSLLFPGKFGLDATNRTYHTYYMDCPEPTDAQLHYVPLSPAPWTHKPRTNPFLQGLKEAEKVVVDAEFEIEEVLRRLK